MDLHEGAQRQLIWSEEWDEEQIGESPHSEMGQSFHHSSLTRSRYRSIFVWIFLQN